jgi:hypothetical protein
MKGIIQPKTDDTTATTDVTTNQQGQESTEDRTQDNAGTLEQQGTSEDKKDEPPRLTFDEFLKQGTNQAEFDKRVNKALQTREEKRKKEENMTAEELAQERIKEMKLNLDQERQNFELEKRKVNVEKLLIQNRLPEEFAGLIAKGVETDEEAKKMVEAVKREWYRQMAEQLKAQARQAEPRAGATGQVNTLKKPTTLAELAKKNRKIK